MGIQKNVGASDMSELIKKLELEKSWLERKKTPWVTGYRLRGKEDKTR